ncbi:MAG: hypothetical protein KDD69_20325, partial [Bdellovibrionales bacterium]|nr:hypothetical protein [Bdellovibrionales bacterium]
MMKKTAVSAIVAGLGALALAVGIAACSSTSSTPTDGPQAEVPSEMRVRMRQAYGEAANLFHYVWAPELFKDPTHEAEILGSLDRLIERFHDVDAVSDELKAEPGFQVTLLTHKNYLRDTRDRFAAGNKEYANWRLRALTANCIACHSRYEVSTDFLGDAPIPEENTFQGRLAAAEFL